MGLDKFELKFDSQKDKDKKEDQENGWENKEQNEMKEFLKKWEEVFNNAKKISPETDDIKDAKWKWKLTNINDKFKEQCKNIQEDANLEPKEKTKMMQKITNDYISEMNESTWMTEWPQAWQNAKFVNDLISSNKDYNKKLTEYNDELLKKIGEKNEKKATEITKWNDVKKQEEQLEVPKDLDKRMAIAIPWESEPGKISESPKS